MSGRFVVACLVGISVLVALGISFLPRAGPRELMRHQVELLLAELLPGPVAWKRVEIFLDPPAIRVSELAAGPIAGLPVVLRAEGAWLDVAAQPLRRGIVEVHNVRFEQAVIDTAWRPGEAAAEKPAEVAAVASPEDNAPLFDFGINVEGATVRIEDSRVEPPLQVILSEVAFHLAPSPEGSALAGSARVVPGGRIEVKGALAASGGFELDVGVDDLASSVLQPYLALLGVGSGTVSGEIAVRGSRSGWAGAEAELFVQEAALALNAMQIDGSFGLRVTAVPLQGGGAQGEVFVDADQASLVLEGAYRKEAGKPAKLRADFAVDPQGVLEVGDFELSIGRSEAKAS